MTPARLLRRLWAWAKWRTMGNRLPPIGPLQRTIWVTDGPVDHALRWVEPGGTIYIMPTHREDFSEDPQ